MAVLIRAAIVLFMAIVVGERIDAHDYGAAATIALLALIVTLWEIAAITDRRGR